MTLCGYISISQHFILSLFHVCSSSKGRGGQSAKNKHSRAYGTLRAAGHLLCTRVSRRIKAKYTWLNSWLISGGHRLLAM